MIGLAPGVAVLVRDDWPEARGPVHVRTPHYLRGRRGKIVGALGVFPDPGDLAFGREAVPRALYHVLFSDATLWGGGGADEVLVEVYEHWLEPA